MDLTEEGRPNTIAELYKENNTTLRLQGRIHFIRWVCPARVHKKPATSIVVELTKAEVADALIIWGVNWRGPTSKLRCSATEQHTCSATDANTMVT
jgi:hypothetical protein